MYCIKYKVKQGETLYSISRHFGVSLNAVMDANPLVNVYNLLIGQIIYIPVSVPQNDYKEFTDYLVKEGDTLGKILEDNRVRLADLIECNDLNDFYLLPGSAIKVPSDSEEDSRFTF